MFFHLYKGKYIKNHSHYPKSPLFSCFTLCSGAVTNKLFLTTPVSHKNRGSGIQFSPLYPCAYKITTISPASRVVTHLFFIFTPIRTKSRHTYIVFSKSYPGKKSRLPTSADSLDFVWLFYFKNPKIAFIQASLVGILAKL